MLLHIFSQIPVSEMVCLLTISTPTIFDAFFGQVVMLFRDEEKLEMFSEVLNLLFLSVSSFFLQFLFKF